jgi:hypothetical protein
VVETPAPQVNFDPCTPQLPLLEVRVKPEPEAMGSHALALGIEMKEEKEFTIRSRDVCRTSATLVPRHCADETSYLTVKGICIKVTFPAKNTCSRYWR